MHPHPHGDGLASCRPPAAGPFTSGGPLSLGRPGHLDQLFLAVGFGEVSTFRLDASFRLASVDDYINFLRVAAAPAMAMLSRLAPQAREATWADMREQLAVFTQSDGWAGPNTLLLTTGRR